MGRYRVYLIGVDNRIAGQPEVIELSDDHAAVEHAIQIVNGRSVEVWEATRLVVRLPPAHPSEPGRKS